MTLAITVNLASKSPLIEWPTPSWAICQGLMVTPVLDKTPHTALCLGLIFLAQSTRLTACSLLGVPMYSCFRFARTFNNDEIQASLSSFLTTSFNLAQASSWAIHYQPTWTTLQVINMLGMIPAWIKPRLTSYFASSYQSKVSTQPYFAFSHPDKVPSRSHTSPLRITAKSHHRIHPYELPHPLHMPSAAFTIQEPFHLAFESSSTILFQINYKLTWSNQI